MSSRKPVPKSQNYEAKARAKAILLVRVDEDVDDDKPFHGVGM